MRTKQQWQEPDSVLPGFIFIIIFTAIGVATTVNGYIQRSFLGPNKPVRIVIHVPVAPPPGGPTTGGLPPEVPGQNVETTLKPADPDEIAAFNDWMAQAENIVNKTQDQEAKQIYGFLKERAILATPLPDGTIQLHEVPKRQDWIAVMPFLERHKQTVPDWEKAFFYQLDSAVAYFAGGPHTPTRLIVLKDFLGLQDFIRGETVLHEGWHAFDIMTRPVPFSTKPGSNDYQHKELYVFEDRITRIMGDPTFSRLLEQERHVGSNSGQVSKGEFYGRCSGTYRPDLEKAFHLAGQDSEDIGFLCQSMYHLAYPHAYY